MAVLSPPLKVMITGDYLKTAIAIARWGLSDLDPQGSIVFCISESLGISCIKSMSWSEIEMLQLGTPAFHNTRGVLCWKRGTSETLHRQKLAPSRPRASLHTSLTHTQLLGWVRSHPNDWVRSHPHDISTHIWLLRLCYTATAFNLVNIPPSLPKYRHLWMDVGDIPRISPYPNVHPTCRPWFASRGQ